MNSDERRKIRQAWHSAQAVGPRVRMPRARYNWMLAEQARRAKYRRRAWMRFALPYSVAGWVMTAMLIYNWLGLHK